ncbi:MAG TPA: VOC family protein [Gemmatimonadaceae bacterium]|nr:VOC family protein [Gemmatimonadaceae bacterium]
MSFRSALARNVSQLQPEYVTRSAVGGRDAVFRFSVPVLRVRDVAETVAWYRRHLGFSAEAFPEHGTHEFAILERDGVQLLVRRTTAEPRSEDGHRGWDLYMWVDGVDFRRLETAMTLSGAVVRPLAPMGSSVAELEIRDLDGYVLCIGGPTQAIAT